LNYWSQHWIANRFSKVKGVHRALHETHLRAMERRLPYRITQCYIGYHPTHLNALTPAVQADTRFTYPGGMEGWVGLGGWSYTEMVYLSTDSHPYTNHLIATWPGVEPTTFWSHVRRPATKYAIQATESNRLLVSTVVCMASCIPYGFFRSLFLNAAAK